MKRILFAYARLFVWATVLLSTALAGIMDRAMAETNDPVLPPAGKDERAVDANDMTMAQLLRASRFSGGLVVHVGCGAGEDSAALAAGGNFIVQGLTNDRDSLERARENARRRDLDGRVSFQSWAGGRLPYADNLVNVLFWQKPAEQSDMAEIVRVLAPNGVAYIREDAAWRKAGKSWPDDIDQWPHYRYDAGSTGASKDRRAGPPTHIQWEAGPRFMRSHEIETGLSSLVTAKGRLYYILDEGPLGITDARFPAKWSLVCRDAFNGILLWKRSLPAWGWQAWGKERDNDPHTWLGTRTRPADVDRLMLADGDTLYVTPSFAAPISAFDGATGTPMRSYPQTAGANEFILIEGLLIVRTDRPVPALTAIRAEDGETRWRREAPFIIGRSLCAAGERLFFHTREDMIALDTRTGAELWRRRTDLRPSAVMAHPETVLVIQSTVTLALSARSGEKLWQGPGVAGQGRYPDMFIVGDLVWSGRPHFNARRIGTGEIVQTLELQQVLESGHHRRCYTDRATANFMITGERGCEFLDLRDNRHKRHNWFRGPCVTGMVPANGLFYVPPHQCFCYPAIRMDGFFALGSQPGGPRPESDNPVAGRLEKGPAYAQPTGEGRAAPDEWPTYRQDARRSGSSTSAVPADLETLWTRKLGDRLTQAVVAGGKVFVAKKDAGTLHCLDFAGGELLWSRTVGGGIDSPPSAHEGLVIFGSRDGYVYALRARDGQRAWRFRLAPEDRQIVAHDRLESAWPAHGSVLILDGLVYASAGRSGFLDGGIYLHALAAETGEPVHQARLDGPYPDIGRPSEAFHKDGHRSDLLTTDGKYLYMGRTVLDRTLRVVEAQRIQMVGTQRGDNLEYRIMPGMRLVASGGFLDETFWNRTWWMYSYVWPGFHYAQQAPKSGQLLVFDDEVTYTVKHYTTRNRHSPMLFPGRGYLLFADDNSNEPLFYRGEGEPAPIEWEPELPEETRWSIFQDAAVDKGPGFTRSRPARWTKWVDVRIEAMVLAGGKLFLAGPPDAVPEQDPLAALEGRMGGILRVVSVKDGSRLADYSLKSRPVFDGLIAARGRLLITTRDGEIVCLGGVKTGHD